MQALPLDSVLWLFRPAPLCNALVAYVTYNVVYALYLSPLRKIPGSFWSRISLLRTLKSDLSGNEQEYMLKNYRKYGNIFVLEPGRVCVCDPEDCRLVLSTHAFKKSKHYEKVDFIEPNMFLTVDPELNKQRRRQMGPALGLANLRKMEPSILSNGVQQLMDKWSKTIDESKDGKANICYYYDFSLMTFDIISSLGFGKAHRSLTTGDQKVVRWVEKAFRLMIIQMVLPLAKRFPFNRMLTEHLHKDVKEFLAFGNQSIEDRKAELTQGIEKPHDLLQSFIDAEDAESKIKMTSSQVTTETIISLLAGADTSSNTISWALHLLLLHPRHYKRCIDEVRSAFAKDHLIRYDEAKERLPYLEACIYETLRVRPVAGNLPRIVPRGGIVLQNYFIPEGFGVSVSITCANMNKDVWQKPHIFYPKRFINNDANKRNVLTFSAGVRICPGKHLAWIEILSTLANILNTFDFSLPEDSLFNPTNLDQFGQPVIMPRYSSITAAPKFPDRDCNVIISKRH
ncbi:hypothetical protein GGI12_001072 [Dipsacomyces acuminosporus]|nr:hypothetical protein GGI12_001072 [Dipsacomyces acuminosporus]